MNKPLLIGLAVAAVLGGLVLTVRKTDWLRPVSHERVQGRLDERLAELDELLGVEDLDAAGWARIVHAGEPLRRLEARFDGAPALLAAYEDILDDRPYLDAWRVMLAEPEAKEAVSRFGDAVPEGAEAPEDARFHAGLELAQHFAGAAALAVEEGDAEGAVASMVRCLEMADLTLVEVGRTDWLIGLMAVSAALTAGAPDVAPSEDYERDDFEAQARIADGIVASAAERVVSLLDEDQRGQLGAALEATLSRLPSPERALLVDERNLLLTIWDFAEQEDGGALMVRRILDGYDAIRPELVEIARLEDPAEQLRRSDLYEERMRDAPMHALAVAAGHPMTYVSLVAPPGPASVARSLGDVRRQAALFLERLGR